MRHTSTYGIVPLLLLLAAFAPLAGAAPGADMDCDGVEQPDRLLARDASCTATAGDARPPWPGSWWGHCHAAAAAPGAACDTSVVRCEERACDASSRGVDATAAGARYRESAACGTRGIAISVTEPGLQRVGGASGVDDDCDGVFHACGAGLSAERPGASAAGCGWYADLDGDGYGDVELAASCDGASGASCRAGGGKQKTFLMPVEDLATGGVGCGLGISVTEPALQRASCATSGERHVAHAAVAEGGRTIGAGVVADIVERAHGGFGCDSGLDADLICGAGAAVGGSGARAFAYRAGEGSGATVLVVRDGAVVACGVGVEGATGTPYATCWA